MNKQNDLNVFAVLVKQVDKKRKIKSKNKTDKSRIAGDYFESKRTETEVTELFKDYFNSKLEKEFQYILEVNKFKDAIPAIKKYFTADASRKFFTSDGGKNFIKKYIKAKNNPELREIYRNHYDIFCEYWSIEGKNYFYDWTITYLEPIHITLTLFWDTKSRNSELKKIGIEKEKKPTRKAGRPLKTEYKAIDILIPHFRDRSERNGKNKRRSGDTATIKKICKLLGIPYNRRIVTAYNNRKLKSKS